MSIKILDGRKLHLLLMEKEEKIYALESELKHVKDLNNSKSETIQGLETELKKRDELLREAEYYLESIGMWGLQDVSSKDCRRSAERIKAILEGK